MKFLDNLDNNLSQAWKDVVSFVQSEKEEHQFLNTDDPETLRGHIKNMRLLLKKQAEGINKITSPPLLYGTVIAINKKDKVLTATIIQGGRLLEVWIPPNKNISPGNAVKISAQTMQIIEPAPNYPYGEICVVRRVLDKLTSEVACGGNKKVVLNGALSEKVESGDRVVLDSSSSIMIVNLGKNEQRFKFASEAKITWDDIGGQREAKEKLQEALELPYQEKELFTHYNKKLPKGFLLIGPPGCGKSMFIEAVATSMAKMHGDKSKTGFMLIQGAQILEPLVGVAEQTIEQIFLAGEEHYKKNSFPAIIAIDEAEALLRKRGSGKSSDVEINIVATFLPQISNSHSIIILATNKVEMLDEAVTRDKRINHIIEIGRPDKDSALEIAKMNLKNVPVKEGAREEMAHYIVQELYSPSRILYEVKMNDGNTKTITLTNIINGAMVAGTIDDVVSSAFQRDRKNKTKTGITKEDVDVAVKNKVKVQLLLDHTNDISEFIKDFADDVKEITIQKQVQ